MSFFNPLDLFGISPQDPAPDAASLRKARRAKLLEFDLSEDGVIQHDGVSVNRADFLKACEELEEPASLAAYRALQRLPRLQAFLSRGDLSVFDAPLPDWAHHPRFLTVVGPLFAERYAGTLADAVRRKDRKAVRRLTSRPPVTDDASHARLYGEAERVVADQAERLRRLTKRIESGAEPELEPARVAAAITDVPLLETLPAYFDGARSKVGEALRLVAVTAFNELDDARAAAAILRTAGGLSTNALTGDRISKDLDQIEQILERREIAEEHGPALEAAADALVRLHEIVDEVKRGRLAPESAVREVEAIVNPAQINSLPDPIAEVRDHVAYAIRGIATTCWNEHHDADAASRLTKHALKLKTGAEVGARLREDDETVTRIAREFSAQAAKEGRELLTVLRKVVDDTRGGLFGPQINWDAVERFLDRLFDAGGIRLLRALRDDALKANIRTALFTLLGRLSNHRSSGASRIRARVEPAFATRVAQATPPVSPPARRPAPSPSRTQREPAGPPPRPGRSPAPPSKEDDGLAYGFVLVALGLFLLFIIIVAVGSPPPTRPETTSPTPASPLGKTMEVSVVAANGKLSPVRVKVDGDVRRPYWVELGDEVTFTVRDSAFVEQELDDVAISVNGKPFPTDYRDSRGRVVITRESVRAVLSGTNLPTPLPGRDEVDDGLPLAELAGQWIGELSRPGEAWSVELNIRPDNEGSISGSILKSRGGNTVTWSVRGRYHGGELQFEEVQILDERRTSGATAPWCSRIGTLQTRRRGSDLVLEGPLQDDSGRCPSSQLRVVRSSKEVAEGVPADARRWNGNQLATGDSPYDAYFDRGVYSTYDENKITFLNGQSADVVICLVDLYSGRVVRNEYIRAGDRFTMTEIPDGTYFIRGFYGRDWNPDLEIRGTRVVGGFETEASFSESRRDPLRLIDDGYNYTSYEVTLYSVSGGNMESSGINASSFFD